MKKTALEIGFDLVGVAPASAVRDLAFSRKWVERGYGGEMRYLENPKRDDPRSILPSVQSVVCAGLVYNAPLPYSTEVSCQSSVVSGQPETASFAAGDGRGTTVEGHADESPRAWISRYAWGRDYHDLMREKLEKLRAAIESLAPGVETRVYVDTGPIVERAFARLSGIGWTGKNTCLINEQKGSWFFLGVVLTSLALEPDLAAPDRCGSCTRCLEACPTGALVEPYVMDASRCIAYLNIELKGSIPEEFRPAIGANIFGCDICQDVCPWNSRPLSVVSRQFSVEDAPLIRPAGERTGVKAAATTSNPEFEPLTVTVPSPESGKSQLENRKGELARRQPENNRQSPIVNRQFSSPGPDSRTFSLFNPRLEDLAAMSEEDFRQAFRHSPIKRAKYRGWLRNLCVAMGNSGDPRFLPKLKELSEHPDPIVREHAAWALDRCDGPAGRFKS